MDVFVTRLNKLIEENKITRYRLAKDLKVNGQTVTFWCEGTNEPKISYLRQLALYFDVSADYLLGLEDEGGGKYSNSFNNFSNSGTVNIR